MLPGCCKNGIVISKIPVMQAGLKEVMRTHFPEYEIISSASAEDLTLLQLRRSGLVIADLAGESEDPRIAKVKQTTTNGIDSTLDFV